MNNVTKDALRLAKIIDSHLPAKNDWDIVNILITPEETYQDEDYKEIPTAFGYKYSGVPEYLMEEGVIESQVLGRWFIGFTDYDPKEKEQNDYITRAAKSKGYLKGNRKINYYKSEFYGHVSFGPEERGQRAVLINRALLREFINKYSINLPNERDFYYENGELKLKMQDGSDCTLDLSKAPILRPIFEAYFQLYRESNKKLFTREELLAKYKEITGQEIEWDTFIKRKSSIHGKMINTKPCLKSRIVWGFNKQEKKYIFEILPLSD